MINNSLNGLKFYNTAELTTAFLANEGFKDITAQVTLPSGCALENIKAVLVMQTDGAVYPYNITNAIVSGGKIYLTKNVANTTSMTNTYKLVIMY